MNFNLFYFIHPMSRRIHTEAIILISNHFSIQTRKKKLLHKLSIFRKINYSEYKLKCILKTCLFKYYSYS